MSVTIISTLPKALPATVADKGANSDPAAGGQDFASVLLGQLAPSLPETLPVATSRSLLLGELAPSLPESRPAATSRTDVPEADVAVTDGTPSDAASVLAALGLVPLEPGHTAQTSRPDDEKVDQTTPASLTAAQTTASPVQTAASPLQTTASAGQDTVTAFKANGLDKTTSTALTNLQPKTSVGPNTTLDSRIEPRKLEPGLTATTAADDKPAKFAVPSFVPTSTDNVLPKNISADIQPNTADPLPNTIPAFVSNDHGNTNRLPVSHGAPLSVPTPVRDQSWAGDFAEKIVWLVANDRQTAQLTLNPPQMGPVEISLNMDKGSATATFVSANADVRDAIETALPRLREMFASAGIELGQTNVSAESFRQQAESGNGSRRSSHPMGDNAILVAESAGSLSGRAFTTRQGIGMVDLFA